MLWQEAASIQHQARNKRKWGSRAFWKVFAVQRRPVIKYQPHKNYLLSAHAIRNAAAASRSQLSINNHNNGKSRSEAAPAIALFHHQRQKWHQRKIINLETLNSLLLKCNVAAAAGNSKFRECDLRPVGHENRDVFLSLGGNAPWKPKCADLTAGVRVAGGNGEYWRVSYVEMCSQPLSDGMRAITSAARRC
jgi:hypothetical protein